MKRILWLVSLIILFNSYGYSQGIPQEHKAYDFSAAASQTGVSITGRGLGFFKLTWSNHGSSLPSACTVTLDVSRDNNTWSTGIPAQTCTTDGSSPVYALSPAWYRVRVASYTKASTDASITIVAQAWEDATSSNQPIIISGMVKGYDFNTGNPKQIDVGPLNLNGLALGSGTNTSTVWIQIFDALAASVTIGTTVPTWSIIIPAGASGGGNNPGSLFGLIGAYFQNALSWACTTSALGSTGASSYCDFNYVYRK